MTAREAHIDVDAVTHDAFGLAEDHGRFAREVHRHRKHQILYAASGTMSLVAEGRRWMLPPQRAAWIRAGVEHSVSSTTGIALRTVYLSPRLVPTASVPAACRVFAVSSLAREMLVHAVRWGPDGERDATREAFFRALAGLALEWLAEEAPFFLAQASSPELARAMAWIETHLADATVTGAAAAAGMSVRTLSRRFEEETKGSFRAYVQSARMIRAMALLAAPRATVTATASAVGFASLGAFTTAFTLRCGETPSAYRERAIRARIPR